MSYPRAGKKRGGGGERGGANTAEGVDETKNENFDLFSCREAERQWPWAAKENGGKEKQTEG